MPFNYFDEQAGSPVVNLSPYGSSARRFGVVPWSQINNLYAYVFPSGSVPHAFPGLSGLLANSIVIEPFAGNQAKPANTSPYTFATGDLDTHNTSAYALAVINYETARVEATQGSDPVANLTHQISVGGQMLDLDPGGLVWTADNRRPDSKTGANAYIATIEHSITWHHVASPPFAAIRACLGTVNSGNLTFNTGTMAPETAHFTGAELSRDILSTGALAWRVTYHFSERRVTPAADDTDAGGVGGWNHFFRSDAMPTEGAVTAKTGWYRLAFAGSRVNAGDPIYALADHSALFA